MGLRSNRLSMPVIGRSTTRQSAVNFTRHPHLPHLVRTLNLYKIGLFFVKGFRARWVLQAHGVTTSGAFIFHAHNDSCLVPIDERGKWT